MTNTNLISGLCPTVTTGEPIAYSFALKDRSDENLPSLAGGRAASESVGDPGWVRFYRGRARELVYVRPSGPGAQRVTRSRCGWLESAKDR